MPRITVTTPNGLKQRYELDINMSTVTIGRDPDCEITIDDESISGFHAEIRRMNGGFCIVDCHSTRGVTVNGVRTEWSELVNGQKVEIGDANLSCLFTDPEINQFLAEKANNPNEEAAPAAAPYYSETPAHPEHQAAAPVYAEMPVQQTAPTQMAPAPVQAAPVQQSPIAQQPAPVQVQQPAPAQPQTRLAAPAAGGARPGIPGRPGMPGRPGAPSYGQGASSSGGVSAGYIITILILCAAALLAGMTMRHYNETGRILFSDLFPAKEEKPVEKKPEPKAVVTSTVKETAPVVKTKDTAKPTIKKAAPVAKDPMDGVLKNNGKEKLPALNEFIIP